MNAPWLILLCLAIASFAFFEWRAFRWPDRQNTLSKWIFDLGKNWPLSIFIMGTMVGGLAVHFFWHWCPDIGAGIGLLSH